MSPSPPWGLQAVIFNFSRSARPQHMLPGFRPTLGPLNLRELSDIGWPCIPAMPFFLPILANIPEATAASKIPGQQGDPPLPPSSILPSPPVCPRQLNLEAAVKAARSYPHSSTARFVAEGLQEGFPSFFAGDRSVHVDLPNMPSAAEAIRELREDALKERVKGRYAGPFPSNPFPNAWCPHQPRNAPAGAVPKNKRSPLDGLKRPVANFSALEEWSVNALDQDPGICLLWMTFENILRAIAASGKGTIVYAADVKAAYRLNRNRTEDLHLHVHKLVSPDHGTEFFVDLCNPFGWKNSYWNWESLAGVIKWHLLRSGITSICNYVDNFYGLIPPTAAGTPDWGAANTAKARFDKATVELGLPMHEHQMGVKDIQCLGWIINTGDWTFSCPAQRLQLVQDTLAQWKGKRSCSLRDLRSITGFFFFISGGFSVGKPDLAHFFRLKTKAESIAARLRKPPEALFVKISPQVAASISFWADFFPKWSGKAPIQAFPSPRNTWDSIWRSDGSTKWGMGAHASAEAQFFSLPWTTEERAESQRLVRESAPFCECLAVLFAVRAWAPGASGKLILFELDCKPAQQALESGFSLAAGMQGILRAIRSLLARNACTVVFRHIPRTANTVADAFSTGDVPSGIAAWTPALPQGTTPTMRDRSSILCPPLDA